MPMFQSGISPPERKTMEKSNRGCAAQLPDYQSRFQIIQHEAVAFFRRAVQRVSNTAMCFRTLLLLFYTSLLLLVGHRCEENVTGLTEENTLAQLVKIFSKPGAFKRINAILGENSIEVSFNTCPKGEEGLECRRAEARRSVDCPQGDCYCYNCATAGPELWASCCRESLRCCSHLAAACRTCDQPTLHPFCSKHFKKCLNEHNEKKQN